MLIDADSHIPATASPNARISKYDAEVGAAVRSPVSIRARAPTHAKQFAFPSLESLSQPRRDREVSNYGIFFMT